jgi:hypothetical protein
MIRTARGVGIARSMHPARHGRRHDERTTVTTPHWRQLAEKLKADQIAELERYEREDDGRPDLLRILYLIGRDMADINLIDAAIGPGAETGATASHSAEKQRPQTERTTIANAMGWPRSDPNYSEWPSLWPQPRGRTRRLGTVDLLAEIVADTPRLPDAACAGHAPMFDADNGSTPRALALCASCPALARCQEWVAGQPADALHGV